MSMEEGISAPSRQMTIVREEDALRTHPQPPPPPSPPPAIQSLEPGSGITIEEFLHCGVTLYQAALNGDWEAVKRIWTECPSWICTRITKGGETVLHIAAAAKHPHLVAELVNIMDIDSLALVNKVGNTALCFAAVSGVVEIAATMVEKHRGLPNIRGSQGMTPLHMAGLLGHRQMVWYLLSVTDVQQLTDQDRIGLLTSCIDTDLFEEALYILHNNRNLALLRDAKKETALHALARKPLQFGGCQGSMWQRFKMQWSNTTQDRSIEPKAALELAQSLWNEVIKQKEEDISKLIAYPWRLLFVAAQLGKVEFLSVLIRSYPDLIWKVDENRFTIFHIAVIHRHEGIFKLIYEIGAIKDLIATYKDNKRNNMLHLASKLAPPHRLNCVSGAALQMQRELLWFEAVKEIVRPEYAEAENDDHKTPQALFSEEHEVLRSKGEEWMKKTAESCALVATLIATVAFSATFQPPGGVTTEGSPVLVKKACFVVFAMSDAVSLFTSTASILMFLSILTSRYAERDFLKSLPLKLMKGLILLLISIATMIVAFTATFFIIFLEGVRWAPIPIALISCLPVTLFAFQQFPLLVDIYDSVYESDSLFKSTKPKLFQLSSSQPNFPFRRAQVYDAASQESNHHTSSHRSRHSVSFHPEVSIAFRNASLNCATASGLTPSIKCRSLHRPTASQIVDPSASEQTTPTLRDIEASS